MPQIYLEDASGYRGKADAFFTPVSAAEVSTFLREASTKGIGVTIAGAGTGVTGARVPDGGWVLSLEKFRRLEIRPGSALAGAGVDLQSLQAAARSQGQFYAPDPTEWTASVGGSIATNASGSRSLLYGPTRAHVRALTVAMASGEVRTFHRGQAVDFEVPAIRIPNTTKHAAGYLLRPGMDWVDLFVGSEGTLGVVLEAALSLLPLPAELLSGVVFFPTEELALAAVDPWRGVAQLRMLEFFDAGSLDVLRAHYNDIPASARAALLIEQQLDGLPGDPVDAWLERLDSAGALGEESWFGDTAADRERFREFRHVLPELVNERVRRNGFQKMSSDCAVPLNQNRIMMAFYRERVEQLFAGQSVIFGHIGDAHVHVNLLPETAADSQRAGELLIEFARRAAELGGTVSAEHGLGKRKAKLLAIQYQPVEIDHMRQVKRRLDPAWILGPGTLLAK